MKALRQKYAGQDALLEAVKAKVQKYKQMIGGGVVG